MTKPTPSRRRGTRAALAKSLVAILIIAAGFGAGLIESSIAAQTENTGPCQYTIVGPAINNSPATVNCNLVVGTVVTTGDPPIPGQPCPSGNPFYYVIGTCYYPVQLVG